MRSIFHVSIIAFLSGCAHTATTGVARMKSNSNYLYGVTSSMIDPKNILKQYKRIVVTDFKSPSEEPIAGTEIADRIAICLLNKGYQVIERDHIKSLLKEKYLSYVGIVNPENLKEFKTISGADALITGTVGTYNSGIGSSSAQFGNMGGSSTTPQSEVSVTMKMFDIETGKILFTAAGSRAGQKARGYWVDEIIKGAFNNYPNAE